MRVGDLKLAKRERVPITPSAVSVRERARQPSEPALEELVHLPGVQVLADRLQRHWILAGGEPVIQRSERDPLLGGLTLGPLVPVEIDPYAERGVAATLDEAGAPVGIEDVPVVVVDHRALAAELEMGVLV